MAGTAIVPGGVVAFYPTLRQHPLLAPLNARQRQQAIRLAASRLRGWRQVLLNVLKLCLLVPPFLFLAWHPALTTGLLMLAWLLGYVLLLRPLQMWLAEPLIAAAVKETVGTG